MFCQQIVEAETRGRDTAIIRSIITTLREGSELIEISMLECDDVTDAASGQVESIIDGQLAAQLSEIFSTTNTKDKNCDDLAREVYGLMNF